MFEAFYNLVLDEIRIQPNLKKELDCLETTIDVAKESLDVLLKILDQGSWQQKLAINGVKLLINITPPSPTLARDFGDWHASTFKDKKSKYSSLCRSALLNLYWKQFEQAEQKVNEAKYIYDHWAYAHHVYGLLRGLQENQEKSRFELELALEREPSIAVKQRIKKAIQLLN